MNKIIIGVVAVIAIAIGWFILNPADTFDYVVNIDQEVTQLENELASLDAQVAAGTLTPAQATEAKVRIITRLDTINNSASESEKEQLTPEQRTQLANGLLRLKDALVRYQATLSVIEDTAVEADVKAQLKSGHSGSSRHLNLIIADTIDDVEETVQDSVQDYEADVELDAQVDAVVEEIEAEEALEAEVEAEESAAADSATTSDEMTDEDMSTTSDEGTGDESDTDVEVSSEAEIQVNP
jgi:ribosomal protein L29